MIYEFNPSIAATYFYHGHFHDQYPDGLIGAMVVTSDLEKQKLKALSVSYDYDIDEFVWLAADYYEAPARSLLTSYYLTNQSGGNEPIPDGYLLNGKLSNSLTLLANRAASYRVRFVNAAALSMFNISVDGMPLTIIEIDGNIVRPYEVSYFVTNKSPAIWFRLTGIPSMYATYNASLPNNGLYGTVSNQPLNLYWTGPSDNNLLAAQNYPPVPTPTYSYAINFTIAFAADAAGVNIALFNNVTYAPPPGASAKGNTSLLFSYLQPRALHSPAPHHQGHFVYDSSSKLNYSLGDGAHPFVLPSQQGVLVRIYNTDTGEHPIHIHGHNFWILSTSDFPEAEHYPTHLQRSVISVPAEGWAKIVLFTDNPGVWFFHCHIDWHVAAGLGANIIEAPELIAATAYSIPPSMISACNVKYPSQAPVKLSASPTLKPTTKSTTGKPTVRPTVKPSEKPSVRPTVHPTASMSTNPNPVTSLGTNTTYHNFADGFSHEVPKFEVFGKVSGSDQKALRANLAADHAIKMKDTYEDLVNNLPLVSDYNELFFSKWPGGKLPDKYKIWIDDLFKDGPGSDEKLEAYIAKNASKYRTATKEVKLKVYFGSELLKDAKEGAELASGKNMTAMFKAMKRSMLRMYAQNQGYNTMQKKWKAQNTPDAVKAQQMRDYRDEKIAKWEMYLPNRKLWLDCLVPPDTTVAATSMLVVVPPKVVRRGERKSAGKTKGTASASSLPVMDLTNDEGSRSSADPVFVTIQALRDELDNLKGYMNLLLALQKGKAATGTTVESISDRIVEVVSELTILQRHLVVVQLFPSMTWLRTQMEDILPLITPPRLRLVLSRSRAYNHKGYSLCLPNMYCLELGRNSQGIQFRIDSIEYIPRSLPLFDADGATRKFTLLSKSVRRNARLVEFILVIIVIVVIVVAISLMSKFLVPGSISIPTLGYPPSTNKYAPRQYVPVICHEYSICMYVSPKKSHGIRIL
eukprot:gene18622-18913_t